MSVLIGPRCNRRVTCDPSPSNARSESAIAVNPLDPYNLVGASKRFTNPATYAFSLAAYASFDGGQSWTEAPSLTLPAGWAGTSDPAVAWDNMGNAYLVGLPFGPLPDMEVIGIAVYKSADGGRTWGAPTLIHASKNDSVFHENALPVMEAKQAVLVDMDYALDDEVWLEPTPGHTPGHVAVNLASKGARAVMCGDLMHTPLQLAEPGWSPDFDYDGVRSAATRQSFLDTHCDTDTLVLTAHFPSPSMGRVVAHAARGFDFSYR